MMEIHPVVWTKVVNQLKMNHHVVSVLWGRDFLYMLFNLLLISSLSPVIIIKFCFAVPLKMPPAEPVSAVEECFYLNDMRKFMLYWNH